MKIKIKFKLGNVFLIPLRNGGYGIGIIARKHRSCLLGYFWKKNFLEIPHNLKFEKALKKEDAFWIKQFGIKGLKDGKWPILGSIPNFDMNEWEIPKFVREIEPYGKYLITYNDKLQFVNQEKVINTSNLKYYKDGLAGYGFIEIKLTKLLATENFTEINDLKP